MNNIAKIGVNFLVFNILIGILFITFLCKLADAGNDFPKIYEIYNTQGATAAEAELEKNNSIEDKNAIREKINSKKAEEFWSFWGVGLVMGFDLGDHKPIKSASIINNKIRVEEEDDVKYGLGLEVHKSVWGTTWSNTKINEFSGGMAAGPYVAILPDQNDIFDAIGIGVLFGFFNGNKNTISMNLGLGLYVDPATQVLADGFEDGKAPPDSETSVRYKKITQYGIQTILSFTYIF